MTTPKNIILALDYPCPWVYKIIGADEGRMRQAVADIMGDRPHRVTLSRISKTGKYHCLNVEVTVEDRACRVALHQALQAHGAIRMIL